MINIKCRRCGKVYEVERTSEIPKDVKSLECNFGPCCEDYMTDYYKEKYIR